jgi:hypothetical protein
MVCELTEEKSSKQCRKQPQRVTKFLLEKVLNLPGTPRNSVTNTVSHIKIPNYTKERLWGNYVKDNFSFTVL